VSRPSIASPLRAAREVLGVSAARSIGAYAASSSDASLSGLAMPLVMSAAPCTQSCRVWSSPRWLPPTPAPRLRRSPRCRTRSDPGSMSVLIASGLTFGLGAISFGGAIRASKIASEGITQVVSVALIVMALSRIVPLSATQFYTTAWQRFQPCGPWRTSCGQTGDDPAFLPLPRSAESRLGPSSWWAMQAGSVVLRPA
jgi:hypothetical protein